MSKLKEGLLLAAFVYCMGATAFLFVSTYAIRTEESATIAIGLMFPMIVAANIHVLCAMVKKLVADWKKPV